MTGALRSEATPAAIDAVVVNWNGRRFLPACLAALRASDAPVRIRVVDNASDDGSAAYVREAWPDAELVALDANVGYAAGANAGLRRGTAAYAVVMNPDVILASGYLRILRERLDTSPAVGAAQGKLYRLTPEEFEPAALDDADVLDSAGHVARRSRMVVDRGAGRPDGPDYACERSVFSACGAALFLRRTMLEDVAPDGEYFDEFFFAYKEDIDLCWRARLLGWDIRYVPAAVAGHVRAWAGGGLPPKDRISLAARRHSWKNHYLLMLKNDRLADVLRALPAIAGWEILRQGYALLRDPALYPAYVELIRLLPVVLRRRRALLGRRRAEPAALRRWFGDGPLAPEDAPAPIARRTTAATGVEA